METQTEQAVSIHNPDGSGKLVVVCEHASNLIPLKFNSLGLAKEILDTHSAWDPGALALAQYLSQRFDSPLVASSVSRLFYDCNRPPSSPTAIVTHTEHHEVPGNQGLTPTAKQQRVDFAYTPFNEALQSTLDNQSNSGFLSALVTVHSFTPLFKGHQRDVEIGILHDDDSRLADAILAGACSVNAVNMLRNEPYSAKDGVTHTLKQHGLPRHLLNVMIEVRNDLIQDAPSIERIGAVLGDLIERGLSTCRHQQLQERMN